MKTYKIIKFVYDKELNNLNCKTYTSKENAKNAGQSWVNDCTIHSDIRKGRAFEIIEINN